MKTTKHDFPQRSEAWEKIRIGKVGGSEAIGLTTPARLKTLIWLKLGEIQAGEQDGDFTSAKMQEAIDNEPIVIDLYEKKTFNIVTEVGYITNTDYEYAGLSPDGLIGEDGAIEQKNYIAKNHCKIIVDGIQTEDKPQLAHYFLILPKLKWIDFVSYNEKVKAKPLHIIRVLRDEMEDDIAKLKAGYVKFESTINEYLKEFS